MKLRTYRVLHALVFQLYWLVTVLAAARGHPWIGPALLPAVVALHLGIRGGARPVLLLTFAGMALGYLADSGLVLAGRLSFPELSRLGGPSPLWMVGLWGNFALALDASLAWLVERPRLAGVLGALGGPLSYLAGEALGAARLAEPRTLTLAAVALVYLAATPALGRLAGRLRRGRGDPRSG